MKSSQGGASQTAQTPRMRRPPHAWCLVGIITALALLATQGRLLDSSYAQMAQAGQPAHFGDVVLLAPGDSITFGPFLEPEATPPPGTPPNPGGYPFLAIYNKLEVPANVTSDGSTMTVAVPDGFSVAWLAIGPGSSPLDCTEVDGQPNVVTCPVHLGAVTVPADFTAIPTADAGICSTFRPPGQTILAHYRDSYAGDYASIRIDVNGPDPSTAICAVSISIFQMGVVFQGTGTLVPTDPTSYALTFTVSDDQGDSYDYQGTFSLAPVPGCPHPGRGSYQSEQNPSLVDQWAIC